ncbi:MAG: PAS domain S-box protein [Magnetospirillum sp.]|nr:PAS domain S-box protein [Magnetospirillum sp.]
MNAWFRHSLMAFVAAIATAGAFALLSDATSSDARQHAATVAAFDSLSRVETSLDRDLLKVTASLLPHNDTLVEYAAELRSQLAGMGPGEVGRGALDDYRPGIDAKLAAVEQVKAVAAFVRMEAAYLPFAIDTLVASNPRAAAPLQRALLRLGPFQPLGNSDDSADLDPLLARLGEGGGAEARTIARHMQVLTEQRRLLRQAISAYFAIDCQSALAAARSRYMAAFAERQERGLLFLHALQVLALGLFGGLGWTISRLGDAHHAAEGTRRRLSDAVDSLREAFALFDYDQRLVVRNRVFDDLFPGPLAIAGFADLHAAMAAQGMTAAGGPKAWGADEAVCHQTATDRWYLFRSQPTAEGGLVCLLTDFTEHQRVEAQMRKLTAAVEQSPISVVITDAEAAIEYVNPRFTEQTGYLADEVAGRNPRMLQSGQVARETYDEMWRTLSAGLTWRGELINRKKSGELYWESAVISPVRDTGGRITNFIAMKEDVTLQKRNADLLIDANVDNERMLFAASHDLQEPVRTVLTYCQKLERQIAAADAEGMRESLAFIGEGARQTSLLIQGLTAYGRSSRPAAAFVPVECERVVRTVAARSDEAAAAVRIATTLPSVLGDPVLLVMLFQNLVDNAMKFRRPDTPLEIRITARAEDGGWRIDVADNGIGIEHQYLDGILTPFSRLHPRATHPGAGLGLASCLKIAKVHGGRLWLDSEPGQGTTVHLWLPSALSV